MNFYVNEKNFKYKFNNVVIKNYLSFKNLKLNIFKFIYYIFDIFDIWIFKINKYFTNKNYRDNSKFYSYIF